MNITIIKENDYFITRRTKLLKEIEALENKIADNTAIKVDYLKSTNYKALKDKSGYPEHIQALKDENNLMINQIELLKEKCFKLEIAASFKTQDLTNNIKIDFINVLINLKLFDKNLTDLRQEKIISKLKEMNSFDLVNTCYVHNGYYGSDRKELSLYYNRACYSDYLKISVSSWDIEAHQANKLNKKEIKTDLEYIRLANVYFDKKKQIEIERQKLLKEIALKNDELKKEYESYYITSDITKHFEKNLL